MWLLIAAGALFILALGVTFFAYHTAFYSRPRRDDDPYALPKGEQYEAAADKMRALIAELERRPFEPVGIRAFDGVELYARYYHVRDGAPLQIQFHGYRGNALRDFCGGHRLALEAGHNVLLIDERANGRSGGHTITFGVKERRDCLAWAQYAQECVWPPGFSAALTCAAPAPWRP